MTELNYTALEQIPKWAKILRKAEGNFRNDLAIKFYFILWAVVCLVITFAAIVPVIYLYSISGVGVDWAVMFILLYISVYVFIARYPYGRAEKLIKRHFSQFLTDNNLRDGILEHTFVIKQDGSRYVFDETNEYLELDMFNHFTVQVSMLTVEIKQDIPEIVFDSLLNDTWLNSLTQQFDQVQQLGLEGDFNNHYRVYAPVKHRIDALSIITPDLMAVLLESGSAFDVLLGKNKIIVRTVGHIAYEAETVRAMIRTMDVVTKEVLYRMRTWRNMTDPYDLLLKRATATQAIAVGKTSIPINLRWLVALYRLAPYLIVGLFINSASGIAAYNIYINKNRLLDAMAAVILGIVATWVAWWYMKVGKKPPPRN